MSSPALTSFARVAAVGSHTEGDAPAEPPRVGTDATSDACLAIDDSGSMWNDTDQGAASDPGPHPLREQAARVAISLLGADVNDARDGIGVVLFGSADQPGDDIVALPVTELSSNAARDGLYARINTSMWSKGFTRIDRALDSCLVLLNAVPAHGGLSRIILLTDGVPVSADPRFDAAGQLRAADWTLQELARRGWGVDVILLGSSGAGIAADSNSFASRIADATHGHVYVAGQRTDLLRIYTQIIASMTGRSLVQGAPVDLAKTSSVPVRVEERTQLMTVTVVKSDASTSVALRSPDGTAVAQTDIAHTSTGLVETLTLHDPAAGLWSVDLSGEGQAYVSLVLKPAEESAAPVTASSPQAAAPIPGESAPAALSRLRSLALRAVGLLFGAGICAGGLWFLYTRFQANRFMGVVAVEGAPAHVVRLADLERGHRILWLIQRPIPLSSITAALGIRGAARGALSLRRGVLTMTTSDDGPGTQVIYGRPYTMDALPSASIVFARSASELSRASIRRPARAALDILPEASFGDTFEPPSPPPSTVVEAPRSDTVARPDVDLVGLGAAAVEDIW